VATNPQGRPIDPVEESKHDVAVAAQEEREAQAALLASAKRDSSPDDDNRRALRGRWQAAARSLAVALENLDRAQRASNPAARLRDEYPPD
jgi:hypothetical protein